MDWSKSKALANNTDVTENLEFERVEIIMGKGENTVYQHFFPFPIMFSKGLFVRVIKNRDCSVKG